MAKEKEFTYEVVKKFGTIGQSGSTTKELRLISWNGGEPKYDIRGWYTDDKGVEKANKGLTLTEAELRKLVELAADI